MWSDNNVPWSPMWHTFYHSNLEPSEGNMCFINENGGKSQLLSLINRMLYTSCLLLIYSYSSFKIWKKASLWERANNYIHWWYINLDTRTILPTGNENIKLYVHSMSMIMHMVGAYRPKPNMYVYRKSGEDPACDDHITSRACP